MRKIVFIFLTVSMALNGCMPAFLVPSTPTSTATNTPTPTQTPTETPSPTPTLTPSPTLTPTPTETPTPAVPTTASSEGEAIWIIESYSLCYRDPNMPPDSPAVGPYTKDVYRRYVMSDAIAWEIQNDSLGKGLWARGRTPAGCFKTFATLPSGIQALWYLDQNQQPQRIDVVSP